ncbi:hypothetical protein LJR118_006709 [Acidovorax sp. LjRoot118]|uniref:hypothetical protein n=1 Tax=Acidovorax sp. LjRoot118 TaxID=3342256 RepID=UPI003ED1384D
MPEKLKNLSLGADDIEALLHILWLRLVHLYSEYKGSNSDDIEINRIKNIAEQLGETFKIVFEEGKSKVAPRRGSMPT